MLPVIARVVGQATGLLLFDISIAILASAILLVIDVAVFTVVVSRFQRERIVTRLPFLPPGRFLDHGSEPGLTLTKQHSPVCRPRGSPHHDITSELLLRGAGDLFRPVMTM